MSLCVWVNDTESWEKEAHQVYNGDRAMLECLTYTGLSVLRHTSSFLFLFFSKLSRTSSQSSMFLSFLWTYNSVNKLECTMWTIESKWNSERSPTQSQGDFVADCFDMPPLSFLPSLSVFHVILSFLIFLTKILVNISTLKSFSFSTIMFCAWTDLASNKERVLLVAIRVGLLLPQSH